MDLADADLVSQLLARDGRRRALSHTAPGPCRYAELYAGSSCPWCEAAERRRIREDRSGSQGASDRLAAAP